MRSWKKKLSGFIAVLVFTTTVLSNFTFNRAFADTGTDSKGKRLTAVDITDNVSDEVKLGYFEDALNEHTIENIDMPKADDEVWVIVQMEQESLVERAARQRTGATVSEFVNSNEGQAISEELKAAQGQVKKAMEAEGIKAEYKQDYTVAMNGFAAKIKFGEINAIEEIPQVKSVSLSTLYYTNEVDKSQESLEAGTGNPSGEEGTAGEESTAEDNESLNPGENPGEDIGSHKEENLEGENNEEDQTSVEEIEEIEEIEEPEVEKELIPMTLEEEGILPLYTGTGMVIAIIDTGLDYNHSAFQKQPIGPALTKSSVAGVLGKTAAFGATGCTADQVYYSMKIPYMFDYADVDTDVIPTKVSVANYGNDHGTHVAGISAGNDDEITGVAPDAQLAIMKVFSDKTNGATTMNILAALNDAIILGVDVINMSLGSSAGFGSEASDSLISQIYNGVKNSGINLVVSAGNAYSSTNGGPNGDLPKSYNPDSGIVGSPSSYSESLSVASIDAREAKAINAGENSLLYAEVQGHEFAMELTNDSYEYVVVPGYGEITDYDDIDVTGKIAVIKRGNLSFNDKQLNAAAKGAAACIIYNNKSGYLLNMSITDYKIPTIAVSFESGQLLSEAETKIITFPEGSTGKVLMSDFSSWGPLPSLELKPEITAPGGNIYSSLPFQQYGYMSGTSMAAPWIAGAASIVRQYVELNYSSLTTIEKEILVDRLLMSTAVPAKDGYGTLYSPRKQGAGVANIENAINTLAYLYVLGEDKPKLELGDDKAEKGVYTLSFHLKNMNNIPLSYNVDASVLTESLMGDGVTVAQRAREFDDATFKIVSVKNGSVNGNKITVGGNKDATITVMITLTEADKAYMRENFKNGIYVEGFVSLEAVDEGSVDLSIPYLSFFGDWTKAPMLDSDIFDEEAPASFDTFPLGSFSGFYTFRMGTYLLKSSEGVEVPAPSMDKIAFSPGSNALCIDTLHYMALGLLRGAKTIDVSLTDKATGEVIQESTDINARKSVLNSSTGTIAPFYAGQPYPKLFSTGNFSRIANNTELIYSLTANMDYADPQENQKNTIEMPVYVDWEAPVLTDDWLLYEKDGRTYVDVTVTDNHQLMAVNLFTYSGDPENPVGTPVNEYYTPIYDFQSEKDKTVTFDITAVKDGLKEGKLIFGAYDYALNQSLYMASILTYVYVDGIKLEESEVTMKINEIKNLHGSVTPENATNQNILWTSSNETVAVVNKGEVTSKAEGVTTITATTEEGKFKAQCVVTVTKEVGNVILAEKVILNQTDLRVKEGTTVALQGSVEPLNTTDKTITFESKDTSIATVDSKGVVSGVKEGTTKVVAMAVGGASAECTVTVEKATGAFDISGGVLIAYTGTETTVTIPEGVREIGNSAFRNNKTVQNVIIPNSVTKVGNRVFDGCTALKSIELPDSITSMGDYTFYGCTSLTRVKMPTKLDYLGRYTFYGCTALTEVTLWSGLEELPQDTFNGCTALKEAVIPLGTKIIGQYAFNNCSGIERIVIPEGVETISTYAFNGCTSAKSVDIPNTVKTIGSSGFSRCTSLVDVVIPNSVTLESIEAASYLFSNCTSLKTVKFPDGIRKLPNSIFSGASSLVSYEIPSTVTAIGDTAFASTGLVDLVVPSNVTNLGYRAFATNANLKSIKFEGDLVFADRDKQQFYKSTALTDITFTGNVVKLPISMFEGCTALKIFYMPDSVEELGMTLFTGCTGLEEIVISADSALSTDVTKYSYNLFTNCNNLKKITVDENHPVLSGGDGIYSKDKKTLIRVAQGAMGTDYTMNEAVENIGDYAFYGATTLKTVKVSPNLKSIGNYAFNGCSALLSFNLPEGLKSIGDYAFTKCTKLESIAIPAGMDTIGQNAFDGCSAVTNLTFGEGLKSIGNFAFRGLSKITQVILPQSLNTIGNNAFDGCSGLLVIDCGGAETIGEKAFYNCKNFTDVKLSEDTKTIGNYAFHYANYLKAIDIPEGTEYIGDFAFYMCYRVPEIIIPDSVTYIGRDSFSYAYGVNEIKLSNNLRELPDRAFAYLNYNYGTYGDPNKKPIEDIFIPASITAINPTAFSSARYLKNLNADEKNPVYTSANGILIKMETGEFVVWPMANGTTEITLPDTMTTIPSNMFSGKKNIKKVVIPGSVTSVGASAFSSSGVKSIIFEDSLSGGVTIGASAFYGCNNLTDIVLPKGLTSIGANAFQNCTSLEKVVMPDTLTGVGNYLFRDCTALKEIVLSNRLKEITSGMFFGCSSLKEINLPASINKITIDIVNNSFLECNSLESINVASGNRVYKSIDGVLFDKAGLTLINYPAAKVGETFNIPAGVTRLGFKAFYGNKNLKEVTLPASLQRIGDKAFAGCYNLMDYIFNSEEAPILEAKTYQSGLTWYGNFYEVEYIYDAKYNPIKTVYPEALTMYYPANGQNYGDSRVYSIFFNNKVEMTVENILQVKGLTAVVSDDHGVDLTWTPTKFAEGYTIERAKVLASNEDGKLFGEFEVLGTVTEPGYQDSDLQFGEYFVYRVTAFKDGGTTSGNGNSVEVYIHPGNETETAALVVIDLIKNLPSVITMEAKDTIIAIRTAYDELTAEAKELVYNYNDFVKAENQLAVLEKEAADKAAAEAVENLIAAIPQPVTLACEEAIEGARQGYDSLTEEQKALVKNYELLTASEETLVQIKEEEKRKEDEAAASKVEDIINALPKNITLHSEPAVVAAREAYDTLTEDQKALVDNYEFLTAAEKKIADLKAEEKRKEDEKAASKVEKLIKLLPRKITLLSEPLIKGAREGYDKLTEDQKALVDNYHVLVAAENRLAEIKEERAKDKEAAAKVEAIIEDLPTKITKDHGPVIKAARKAYDNLTLAQKLLVNNYPKLIKAEVDLWKAEHSNCPWWSLCHWIN